VWKCSGKELVVVEELNFTRAGEARNFRIFHNNRPIRKAKVNRSNQVVLESSHPKLPSHCVALPFSQHNPFYLIIRTYSLDYADYAAEFTRLPLDFPDIMPFWWDLGNNPPSHPDRDPVWPQPGDVRPQPIYDRPIYDRPIYDDLTRLK
jgi:hypothetical protein